jgi:peptidoglycan/xylan/chitin deacetylase (PgdA/CDA1 family)
MNKLVSRFMRRRAGLVAALTLVVAAGVGLAAPAQAAETVTVGGQAHSLDGTNVYRAANLLVRYTPAYGATTGTNPYGFEAEVVGGVVTKIADSVGNMAIPADGFVLSGHGTSRAWLKTNAKLGAPVGDGSEPPPPPPPPPGPKPTTVSLTFDDSFADQTAAMSVLQEYGMKATLFVNSPRVGTLNYLSKEQLDAYAAAGNEIGGHTLTHPDLTTVSADEARRQICTDRVNLLGMGYSVTSFANPFGTTNATVQQIIRDCGYNSARGVDGLRSPGYGCLPCVTAETLPPADVWKVRTPSSVMADTTLQMLQDYVTRAEGDAGGWVPLLFHHVCSGCAPNAVDPDVFRAFVDWLSKRPATTLVKTVNEVVGGSLKPGVPYVPPSTEVTGVTIGAQSHVVDGTDAYRAANMLIMYTPARGATTGSNAYGTEVAVVDGVVTAVQSSVGNMAIPPGGYVLSGHGTSNTWLRNNAQVGAVVTLSYGSTP